MQRFHGHISIVKLLKRFCNIFANHIQILYHDFDAVKDAQLYGVSRRQLLGKDGCQNEENRKLEKKNKTLGQLVSSVNVHYCIPNLVVLYIVLDTLLTAAVHHFEPSIASLWIHLIFPRVLWPVTDASLLLIILMTSLIFGCLLTDQLTGKYTMYLLRKENSEKGEETKKFGEIVQNGRLLSRRESCQIVAFRRKVRPLLLGNVLFSFLAIDGFCSYFHVIQSTCCLHDHLLLLATNLFIAYSTDSNINLIINFCLTAGYIRIKQRHRMTQFRQLWSQIVSLPFTRRFSHQQHLQQQQQQQQTQSQQHSLAEQNRFQQHYHQLWSKYQAISGQMGALFEEIAGHNAFWCKYLTVNYLSYVLLSCNFTYLSIFTPAKELALLERAFFRTFGLAFFAILVLITWQCSLLVYGNCRLHRTAQRTALTFHSHLRRRFTIGELLKVDGLTANYEGVPAIGFKLLNNYRINSKMFEMLFSYAGLLFMMIFQKREI